MVEASAAIMSGSFRNLQQSDITVDTVMGALFQFGLILGAVVGPIFLLMVVVGLSSNLIQVGFLLTLKPLKPDFSRVNPYQGVKRLLSPRSLVELLKAIFKVTIVGFVVWRVLSGRAEELLALPVMPWPTPVYVVVGMAFDIGIWSAGVLVGVALLDYAYQRQHFERSIRMSRQEVREELKQTEGNPVIRQRVRQLQRAVAQRRMMQAVPQADVVITNPTHYAVALQYESGSMRAPRVIAKGQDLIALQIRRVAEEHGVPTMENKPLAQALYRLCEVGDEIPLDMYATVAEVLAFVYRLRSSGLQPHPAPV